MRFPAPTSHDWITNPVGSLFAHTVNYFNDLYHPSNSSEYMHREFWDTLLPWHPYTAYDKENSMKDYMKNRGLTWSDVKYPSQHSTGVGASAVGALNYVSSNIYKLYR